MRRTLPLALLVASTWTHAYEPEVARNNFAHEAAECSGYFLFVSTVPSLAADLVKGFRAKYEALFQLSVAASSPELTEARVKLSTETMQREMKFNWSNLSIVNQKYSYPCIDFSRNPEARLQYWLDKKE